MKAAASVLFVLLAACSAHSVEDDSAGSANAVETEVAPLDCSAHGGAFPEAAMLALHGSYKSFRPAITGQIGSLTVGPLEDVPGWGGKNASYTRDVGAPCIDFAAIGDGSHLTPGGALPMTSAACAGQSGTLTTIFDNPAIGAIITFKDKSNVPAGSDAYFVTQSKLEHGVLTALCVFNAASGSQTLLVRTP